jgi:hypothetical protein
MNDRKEMKEMVCWLYLLFPLLWHVVTLTDLPDSQSKNTYPPCPLYGDTHGKWIRTSEINSSFESEIRRHFSLLEPGEALAFSEIWIPHNCSYRRFTKESIFHMIDQKLRKSGKYKQVHIGIFGDSAIRGIFCGLTRILSGSELYGSSDNLICGDNKRKEITMDNAPNQLHDVEFGNGLLKVTFSYTSRMEKVSFNLMEKFLTLFRADAMFLNTGAWDFDYLSRNNLHDPDKEFCDSDQAILISQNRSSPHILKMFHELSFSAKKSGTRLIYRNSHYNKRFSAECADLLLENNLLELQAREALTNDSSLSFAEWEIWDNRRISKDIYLNQCWDGFHFDRPHIQDFTHYPIMTQFFSQQSGEIPGAMEIQLAQSLLNALFHEQIIEEYHRIHRNKWNLVEDTS